MTMFRKMMTIALMSGMTLGGMSENAWAELQKLTARQVVEREDSREDGDDSTADLEMTLMNKRGQERIRKVKSYRKDYGEDSKSILFFLEPADVKNTGFLSWEYDDDKKDDDQWLYLPALKKIRRISSSDQSDYFMGTDFTYNDMGDRDIDDYTYQHLEAEVIDGVECYHIEAIPKTGQIAKEDGYGRIESWIRADIWLTVKAKFFDRKLKLLKELTIADIEQIEGIWTPQTLLMENIQKKHKTLFTFSNTHYNTGLRDDIFSQRRLSKGIR